MKDSLDRLILQALTLQPNHGHGISQRLERLTRGGFELNQGALYPALYRLEATGAVTSQWSETPDGQRAKYYELTASGRRQLKTRTDSWNRYAEIARQLTREVADAGQLDTLAATVVHWVREATGATPVALFARSDTNPGYGLVACRGDDAEVDNARLPAHGALLDAGKTPFEPQGDTLSPGEAAALEALSTRLVVPLRAKGDPIGFICLGTKTDGTPYGDDDREFLATVADQLGLGLASLRLRSQQTDLDDATVIQRRLLPAEIPQRPGFDIAGSWTPAKAVGGDYYDVLELGNARLGLCIGDVVGKGVPAALLMANLQAAVKAFATTVLSPSELAERVNRIIGSNINPGKFITFFYGTLDARAKTFTFTNAGHNPPLLVHADGTAETLATGGPVLGIFESYDYEQGQVGLRRGDRLVLFTDGVTELWNRDDVEFGEERLLELLRDYRTLDASGLRDLIVETVTDFSHGDFHDDLTLVVVAVG